MTSCARPTCAFYPLPRLADDGTVAVSPFCSELCEAWVSYASSFLDPDTPQRLEGVIEDSVDAYLDSVALAELADTGMNAAWGYLRTLERRLNKRVHPGEEVSLDA